MHIHCYLVVYQNRGYLFFLLTHLIVNRLPLVISRADSLTRSQSTNIRFIQRYSSYIMIKLINRIK